MTRPETGELHDPGEQPSPRGSLRGAFVSVLLMAAFFVVTWFGMLALALERR